MTDPKGARAVPAEPHRLRHVRLDGVRKQALETGRNRLLVTGVVFTLAFTAIAGRLVGLTVLDPGGEPAVARTIQEPPMERANILDRNGVILATSLPTASLYADPRDIVDAENVADRLVRILPELEHAPLVAKLRAKNRFVWIKRNLTPKQQYAVNRLGLPGLIFEPTARRVYPHGRAAAHILGFTDVDGQGIAGVERQFDGLLRGGDALALSIDVRVQAILREELLAAMREFSAVGAAGLVLDADSGETLALVSLPDFDPNRPLTARGRAGFNRATKSVYEMGSTFKLFTTAMALDSGTVSLRDGYDATKPIRVSRYTIADYHGKNRWLSVPEILVYSSNIGAARMAMDVGTRDQRSYLRGLGLLRPAVIELPEVATPLMPSRWRNINTMTIGYGHGIAVTPVQVADAVATLVNGGIRYPATVLKRAPADRGPGQRVLSARTSEQMRRLMRLVVRRGTGRKAETPGYRIGGKTGTAEKQTGGQYRTDALISSFVGAFPIDRPRYVVMALLDEPRGTAHTNDYATGGWVAAPLVGRVVRRMAPLVGIPPAVDDEEPLLPGRSMLASLKTAPAQARGLRLAAH
jgi:cell division protein FtsI (penicillin-binding protein 3)